MRALALLPPDAADALYAHGCATPDGNALCVPSAKLRGTLRGCLPSGALLEGRVTGFSPEAGELCVRLEGRAGRRSQRQVFCAALVGAGGASCAVRAALLGAAPLDRELALWRGVSAQTSDAWRPGVRELSRDADGAIVGAAVKLGQRVHWSLHAPPLPPRAAVDGTAVAALAFAVASSPSLAAAVASTPADAVCFELIPEPRRALRAQSGALLLGQAARGVASAELDDLATTYADVELLMQALQYTPGDLVSATAAYAAAAFQE